MYSDLDQEYRSFVENWVTGIGSELCYWDSVMKNGQIWDYERPNKFNIQTTDIDNEKLLKILDVGAGPITYLEPKDDIFIIACDPLADYYNSLIQKYNIISHVKTEFCFSERLYEKYKENFFDEVHMRNALDHSCFPMISIFNMLYVTKIGGKVILKHWRNEAEIENYSGFHQFNIDIQNSKFVLWNKNINIVLNDILKDIADITYNISNIDRNGHKCDWVHIEIIKRNNFNILDYIYGNYYFDKYYFICISKLMSNVAREIELDKEIIRDNYRKLLHYNNIIKNIAWWIPIKKYRDKFKNKFCIQ